MVVNRFKHFGEKGAVLRFFIWFVSVSVPIVTLVLIVRNDPGLWPLALLCIYPALLGLWIEFRVSTSQNVIQLLSRLDQDRSFAGIA